MFRPRQAISAQSGPPQPGLGRGRGAASNWVPPFHKSPVEGLRKYQRGGDDQDYRHRMVVNVLGLLFCIMLAIAGVWLANEIAEMKRVQDCVLTGRSGCVPLKIPVHAG